MLAHVPSLAAIESDDNGRLVAEFRLARLRAQAAVVRALADHVEYLARSGDADGLSSQVIEEMARLGCRLLEAAGALAESQCPEQSGVFARARIVRFSGMSVRFFTLAHALLGGPPNREGDRP